MRPHLLPSSAVRAGFTVGPVNGRHAWLPITLVTQSTSQIDPQNRMWGRLLATTGQPLFGSAVAGVRCPERERPPPSWSPLVRVSSASGDEIAAGPAGPMSADPLARLAIAKPPQSASSLPFRISQRVEDSDQPTAHACKRTWSAAESPQPLPGRCAQKGKDGSPVGAASGISGPHPSLPRP